MITDRKLYIGGSDAAAILGVSPWRTAVDVYLQKQGGKEEEVTPAKQKLFNRGKRLEPYVLELFKDATCAAISKTNHRYFHPEYPFIGAEIDAETEAGANVEIKTVGSFAVKDWGEAGTDEIPLYYLAQVMHGLAVTSRDSCLVGALLGLDDFRVYRVARDADLCALILEKEKAFWTNNVLKGVPPVELVRDDAIKLFKKDTGEVVEASAELAEAVHRIKKLREVAKVHAAEEERLLNLIKAEMKDAAVLEYDGQPLCSWKT